MAKATTMLLKKAWLESKARFTAAAIILTLLGISTVLRAPATIAGWERIHRGEQMSYPLYVWLSLPHGFLQFLWIIAAVILGLGGLLREDATGSSGFSLGLPVSRRRHVITRAVVGAAEAIVLGFIPLLLVVILSPLVQRSYPLFQALIFATMFVLAGLVFYALGFFLSHILRGEYAAPTVGLALIAAFYIFTKLPRFESLNVFDAMDGKKVLVGYTFFLGTEFPIVQIVASVALAVVLMLVSINLVNARDF
ncbi:MAG TPA: ABC transporter permease subunit [Gemmatimonadaceae bacterium]|nr:ABC transporter permease subunit [Gemmatimonadaceae bacterium]